jgi:hypothetical protein
MNRDEAPAFQEMASEVDKLRWAFGIRDQGLKVREQGRFQGLLAERWAAIFVGAEDCFKSPLTSYP